MASNVVSDTRLREVAELVRATWIHLEALDEKIVEFREFLDWFDQACACLDQAQELLQQMGVDLDHEPVK